MISDYNTDYEIPCHYCVLYNNVTKDYPINSATLDSLEFALEIPRCNFHFQYKCASCDQDKHFNGISWCGDCKQYTCISCSSVKTVDFDFFHYDYYYEIRCTSCEKQNPALDAAEYLLQHPFQTGELRPDFPVNLWIPAKEKYEPSKFKGLNQFERYNSWISNPSDQLIKQENIDNQYNSNADKVSNDYLQDVMLMQVVYPAILAEMGDLTDKTVFDFGCGVGGLTRQLREAKQIVGLDPSNMIDLAEKKEQDDPLGIVYHKTHLAKIKDQFLEKFDVVVSNAVLTEVPDLAMILKDLFDIMTQDSRLVFTVRHPAIRGPSGWESMVIPTDSLRNEDIILTRHNYYAEGPYTLSAEGHVLDGVITHHHTLSTYINTLVGLGFTIDRLFEPRPSKELIDANPKRFKSTQEFHPVFLGIVARKQ